MKTCSHCKESKDESEFNKSRLTKDGFSRWCKRCKNEKTAVIRKINLILPPIDKSLIKACDIIKDHNNILKDDPDRLHSDFLTQMICSADHRKRYIESQIDKVRFDPDKKWEILNKINY